MESQVIVAIRFSHHALARMRQRGIPGNVAGLIYLFGETVSRRHGADVMLLSEEGMSELRTMIFPELVDKYRKLLKDCYLVVDGDRVITLGIRKNRIHH